MSKVSFRARALDSGKPLPLFYEEELPDLSEYVAINRTVPQMPTGMEKEEESERHLQKVMNARQNLKDTTDMVIPIPEAAIPVPDYSNVYQKIRGQPYTYIRMPGLGPDEELPDYDLDSEDEEWLSVQSRERPLSPLHFECMMDRLEKGSGNTVLSEHDAQVLLKDDDDLVMAVYDYWLAKRLRLSRPLIPSVKNERREGTSSSNPYLAFRKRTEKMQTRKNRKNDEQAYMHMLKLKRDLTRSVTLLELMKEREQRKYDYALIQAEIFRKRYLLQDWSGSLISSLKPNPPPNSTGRRLSTPDNNKWDGKNLLIKGDYFDESDGVVPLNTKTKKKRRKGPIYTPTMLDQESPLATIGLSKSDKELKETDKVDLHEERIDVEELDGPFTFKRKIHLRYHKSRSFTSWPWDRESIDSDDIDQQVPLKRKKYCFSRTTLNGRQLGFSRRRIGRGGRSIWDFVPEARVPKGDDSLEFGSYNGQQLLQEQEEQFNGSSLMESSDTVDIHQSSLLQSGQDKEEEVKRPHFHPVSPKLVSSVHFEFVNLPFIDPSSYPCPELSKGYSHFTGRSLNDEDEGVSSFSSLPTSQFTLRPCVNPEQTTGLLERSHQPESNKDVCNGSFREDQQKMAGDEVVWKKFTQSQIDSKHVSSSSPILPPSSSSVGESCSNNSQPSSSTNSLSLNIPSTHLSSLETGLPIQIHVDNLMHFPKKDSKGSLSSENKPHTPLSVSAASSSSTTNTSSAGGSTSAITNTAPPNQSNKPQPITKEALVWFKDCPSSTMLSLNNDISRRNRNNRFRCTLPPSLAKSVTTRFKTEVKPEQQPQQPQSLPSIVPPNLPPPLSLSNPAVAVSPSSPSPHPLLSNQHQIVSSLISDPKKFESFVRDKKHFVTTISSNSHQNNNSSNGTAGSLELNHTSKLPLTDPSTAAEKAIKHTLAARTAIVNHSGSGLTAESGSGNVLVKLSSGNPPSEVT